MFSEPAKILEPLSGGAEHQVGPRDPAIDINLSKLQETVENRGAWCATVHEAAKSQE